MHATRESRLGNAAQSLVIVTALVALLGTLGWLLAGPPGVAASLGACAGLVLVNPATSPRLVLRLTGARPLPLPLAPGLHSTLRTLAARAHLPVSPDLYVVPGAVVNAFALGAPEKSAIGVTEGFLARLDHEEAAGVLAHEVGHIANEDLWVMGLAGSFARLTAVMSIAGQILVVASLPAAMLGSVTLNWPAVALLTLAPAAGLLLQAALSRVREYAADEAAARLCGSARPLLRALHTIERTQGHFLERLLGGAGREPWWVRSHPPTGQRIRRLFELDPAAARALPAPGTLAPLRARRWRYPPQACHRRAA